MKSKIEKSTYWFLVTALVNIIYFPVVHFLLKNPNFAERFKGAHYTLYASYLYAGIGLIWLVFGLIYIAADCSQRFKFSKKSKRLHFYLTVPFVLCLMLVPILDTFSPTSGAVSGSWIGEIAMIILPIAVLAFFVGIVVYIINLIQALVRLAIKK